MSKLSVLCGKLSKLVSKFGTVNKRRKLKIKDEVKHLRGIRTLSSDTEGRRG